MLYQLRDRITTLSGYEPLSLPAHTSTYIYQLINLACTLLQLLNPRTTIHDGSLPYLINFRYYQRRVMKGYSIEQWKLQAMELCHEVPPERRRRLEAS